VSYRRSIGHSQSQSQPGARYFLEHSLNVLGSVVFADWLRSTNDVGGTSMLTVPHKRPPLAQGTTDTVGDYLGEISRPMPDGSVNDDQNAIAGLQASKLGSWRLSSAKNSNLYTLLAQP
jgi:hypothetical protein